MNTVREIEKINQEELDRGLAGTSASWHEKYSKSAWVYVGNLDHELTEGDIICVLSQYGEIEDIHLVREEDTGKSRGFAFVKYEDARSCVVTVDNLIGVKLLGRSIRIDHVEKYKLPKKLLEKEEEEEAVSNNNKKVLDVGAGHAYKGTDLKNQFTIHHGQDLFAKVDPTREDDKDDEIQSKSSNERKRRKRDKQHKKKKEKRKKHDRSKGERRYKEQEESSDRDSHSDRNDGRRKKHSRRRKEDDDDDYHRDDNDKSRSRKRSRHSSRQDSDDDSKDYRR